MGYGTFRAIKPMSGDGTTMAAQGGSSRPQAQQQPAYAMAGMQMPMQMPITQQFMQSGAMPMSSQTPQAQNMIYAKQPTNYNDMIAPHGPIDQNGQPINTNPIITPINPGSIAPGYPGGPVRQPTSPWGPITTQPVYGSPKNPPRPVYGPAPSPMFPRDPLPPSPARKTPQQLAQEQWNAAIRGFDPNVVAEVWRSLGGLPGVMQNLPFIQTLLNSYQQSSRNLGEGVG